MANYCPADGSHHNWYGALFCGHCGARMFEKKIICKNCGHEVIRGNDLTSGWGTNYCTLCGVDSSQFEVIVQAAEGRIDLLPDRIRRRV